jgi:hypothetical protein
MTYLSPYPSGCSAADIDDNWDTGVNDPDYYALCPDDSIEEEPEDFEEGYTDLQNMLAYG